MKPWIPLSIALLGVAALIIFYYTGSGGEVYSLGLLNLVGLIAVFLGIVAAFFILGRATPVR